MLAQGARPAAKTTLPESVAENYYVVMARLIFILGQCPALFSLRSQQGKQICRNTGAHEAFGLVVSGQIKTLIVKCRDLFEDLTLCAIIFVLSCLGIQSLDVKLQEVAPNYHQSIRVLIRQRTQEDAIDNTEDG